MFKKILLIITLLYAAAAFAAVDVNKATAAELDGVKGIGPGLSTKILDERNQGDFKDWSDFIARVGGVGEKTAARLSAEGLTVNGKKFSAAAVAKAKAKADKAEKADKKAKDAQAADKNGAGSKGKQEGKSTAAEPAVQPPTTTAPAATAADTATKK
jgi:competence protein ComEA